MAFRSVEACDHAHPILNDLIIVCDVCKPVESSLQAISMLASSHPPQCRAFAKAFTFKVAANTKSGAAGGMDDSEDGQSAVTNGDTKSDSKTDSHADSKSSVNSVLNSLVASHDRK